LIENISCFCTADHWGLCCIAAAGQRRGWSHSQLHPQRRIGRVEPADVRVSLFVPPPVRLIPRWLKWNEQIWQNWSITVAQLALNGVSQKTGRASASSTVSLRTNRRPDAWSGRLGASGETLPLIAAWLIRESMTVGHWAERIDRRSTNTSCQYKYSKEQQNACKFHDETSRQNARPANFDVSMPMRQISTVPLCSENTVLMSRQDTGTKCPAPVVRSGLNSRLVDHHCLGDGFFVALPGQKPFQPQLQLGIPSDKIT
jgi:hypothetical protein